MKTILTTLSLFLITSFFAQEIAAPTSLNVTEAMYSIDGTSRNGFDIILPGEAKDINSAWGDYLKDKFDFDVKSKGTNTTGEALNNLAWSDKQFTLKSSIIKDASGNHLRTWVFFGPDILANTQAYPTESVNIKKAMKDFSKGYYKSIFERELAAQTKVVSNQGEEVEDLVKDKEKAAKAIAKEKSSIEKATKKKEKFESKIEKYKSRIIDLDKDVKDAQVAISSKSNKMESKSDDMKEASQKFENVEAQQERIRAKIMAVERL